MGFQRFFAVILTAASVLWVAPANAQSGNRLPRIFGEVQTLQVFATGPVVFEDADTATIGKLKIQLFGIEAPDIDEACTRQTEIRATCGLIALSRTLELVDEINPLDCLIVAAKEDNVFLANCLLGDFDDAPLGQHTNNLAEVLVLSGVARTDDSLDDPDISRFKVAELAAQRAGEGFWDCDGSTPRSWLSEKNRLCN